MVPVRLAPDWVYRAPAVALGAVGSYPTFSSLPFPCGRGGLFSVALSVTTNVVPRLAAGILPCGVRTFLADCSVRMRVYDCLRIIVETGLKGSVKGWFSDGSGLGLRFPAWKRPRGLFCFRNFPLLMRSWILSLTLGLASVLAAEEPKVTKVACIGDSITQGSGTKGGMSYPNQLQKLLGEKYKVGNFGVSGRTLLKKGDFPYWKEKAYQNALKMEPDVVVIMLGTNDTKPQNWKFESEFSDDYKELVKSFQALSSKPKVWVCLPVPVPGKGNYGINEENVQKEIPRIEALAKELGCGIIDMHAALDKHPEFLPDRVHPNNDGAGEMAKAAAKAITGQ